MLSRRSSSGASSESGSGGTSSPRTPSPSGGMYVSLSAKIKSRVDSGDHFFSFEFFPPRTAAAAVNLLARFERMQRFGPLFCDLTWHPAGHPTADCETSSMTIAGAALNYCGMNVMLHMVCCVYSADEIRAHLNRAKDLGIRNILALRGDPPHGLDKFEVPVDGFSNASDLVRFIRAEFDDYFTIGVAGYPYGHPECDSYDRDLQYLKEKVYAGADFIITQMFFEASSFIRFVNDCRRIGITCPIIPGILPIQSYDSLRQIVKLSKLTLPDEVVKAMELIKDNDEAIRQYGIEQAVHLCKELLSSGSTHGLHFYTLNREVATRCILERLGLYKEKLHKALPWSVPANHRRVSEDVRPIFWMNRSRSYIYRTQEWDEFPNGRWGNATSPAFGELKDYHLFYIRDPTPRQELLHMWGTELHSEQDVYDVFATYLTGEKNHHGIVVTRIPWSNAEQISDETRRIRDRLATLNRRGVLTINSQPNVNGVPSDDPVFGWGAKGGYVYQKTYLEFFVSEKHARKLVTIVSLYHPRVNYHIINRKGDEEYTNNAQHIPIAVTWGVFPGREIVQPTIVDPLSFKVWKDEAFDLWTIQWQRLYSENSESYKLIDNIANSYFLVSLVDNDYVANECCLWSILEEMLSDTV